MNKDAYRPFGEEECLDVFTHYAAFEHLKYRKPRVLYIAYGETDEWAHSGKYRSYLDAAHQVDQWLSQLWDYLQKDPFYKGKTALFITVDHGRGDVIKKEWTSHNNKIQDCDQIWFATLGPGIPAKGEIKKKFSYIRNSLPKHSLNCWALLTQPIIL
jgi:bisphosphoglycerate-independent phosphoglycerate mutase (AlkP superfamily)